MNEKNIEDKIRDHHHRMDNMLMADQLKMECVNMEQIQEGYQQLTKLYNTYFKIKEYRLEREDYMANIRYEKIDGRV